MKFLDNLIHKVIKPHFEKGGKLEKLYYAFEAGESFLFVTDKRTNTGAHVRDHVDLKRMMVTVIIALLPCLLWGTYNVGFQQLVLAAQNTVGFSGAIDCLLQGAYKVVPLMLVVYTVGGSIEALFAVIRKHEINEGFLVTGMLITLIMPTTIPLWQAAIGTAFGVIIGKEVFGGTGMNILNPALTVRAFIFFAYPQNISGDKVWVAPNTNFILNGASDNAVTYATPLGQAINNIDVPQLSDLFFGFIPGSIGEVSTFMCILAGIYLVVSGVASWKTIVAAIIGGISALLIFKQFSTLPIIENLTIIEHLCMGGFAFGVVFMCTDPVSSAQTSIGKWIFGLLVGALAMTIRCLNPAYPEGIMLAVLFMNVFAPLIDHYVIKANIKRRLSRARN